MHRNDNIQHGGQYHWDKIVKDSDDMFKSGNYSEIWVNKRLSSAGLVGTQQPDIIAKRLDGAFEYIEYASPSQANGTHALKELIKKMTIINDNNGITGKLLHWGEY